MANAHDTDAREHDDRASRATPRWVKVSMAIVLGLIVLFIMLHLTGNGFGMNMHMPMTPGAQP